MEETKPTEVEAEIIEPVNLAKAPEPAITYTLPTATIDNLQAVEEYVGSIEEFFAGVRIDVADDAQVKDLKAMRADLNKVAKAIDDKRKGMDREVKAAMSEADGALNGLRDRVRAVYASTGKQIEEAERLRLEARSKLLSDEYEAVAPDLMALIPLEAFIAREPKLLHKSVTGNAACNLLDDLVAKAVGERKTLETLEHACEADMAYCRTLDVAKALAENARLVKAEADKKAHEEAAKDLATKVSPEAGDRLQSAVDRAHDAVSAANASDGGRAPQASVDGHREGVRTWVLVFDSTKSEAVRVRDFIRTVPGITGRSFKEATNGQ